MATKVCKVCQAEKDLESEFYTDKRNKDGRQGTCKPCVVKLSKEWREAHREKSNATKRMAYRRNPQRDIDRFARWRARNKERMQALRDRWVRENPEKHAESHRASQAKRRARKRGHEGKPFSSSDIAELFELQGGRCNYCALVLLPGYHADHIKPLSRGGGNGRDNICLACPSCNRSKHDKLLFTEWVPPIQNILLDAAVMLMYSR